MEWCRLYRGEGWGRKGEADLGRQFCIDHDHLSPAPYSPLQVMRSTSSPLLNRLFPSADGNYSHPSPSPLQVMGGTSSPWFGYFRLLVMRGFLEARRHRHELIRSVAAAHMATGGSLPCFRAGDAAVSFVLGGGEMG
eukprot:scaffold24255_cov62-Isochrysis_galbana.AAC.1